MPTVERLSTMPHCGAHFLPYFVRCVSNVNCAHCGAPAEKPHSGAIISNDSFFPSGWTADTNS